jgi:hypothetical protein
MVEAAEPGHALVERVLARMAEWGVAEVVGERQRFGEVLVEPESARAIWLTSMVWVSRVRKWSPS